MTKGAYYNEYDPYAAQWPKNRIVAGHNKREEEYEHSTGASGHCHQE